MNNNCIWFYSTNAELLEATNNSPNFVQKQRKNISWDIAETIAHQGISFVSAVQYNFEFNVFQIKGEYQFNYLEHTLLLVQDQR